MFTTSLVEHPVPRLVVLRMGEPECASVLIPTSLIIDGTVAPRSRTLRADHLLPRHSRPRRNRNDRRRPICHLSRRLTDNSAASVICHLLVTNLLAWPC